MTFNHCFKKVLKAHVKKSLINNELPLQIYNAFCHFAYLKKKTKTLRKYYRWSSILSLTPIQFLFLVLFPSPLA